MNKELYLVNCNEENFFEETPEISAESVDNDMITLIIDFDKPLKEQTDYNKELEEKIYRRIQYENDFLNDLDNEEFISRKMIENEIEILTEIIKSKKNLLDFVDEVHFYELNEETLNYIKSNKELCDKKIVIEKKIPLDEELIMNISKEFGDNKNVFIFLENNDDAVSIQECKETFLAINNIVKETKTYNFSPLEELFYIYDIVRDKVYKKESEEQKITTSRDLSKALLGDKIVCLGYAAIFDTILKKIGYKTDITLLYRTKNSVGHARNRVYINDEKYKIEGIYDFDITWDSKKREHDNSFLNSYKYFANSKFGNLFIIDLFEGYKDIKSPALDKLCLDPNKVLQYIENDCIINAPSEYIKTLNYIFNFMQGETLGIPSMETSKYLSDFYNMKISQKKEIIKKNIIEYLQLFDNNIPDETFLKALLVVRKKQNEKNPDKYPCDVDTLFEIAVNSNWRSLFDYEEEIDCDNEEEIDCDNEELNCMSDDKEDDELVDNCFSKKKTLR